MIRALALALALAAGPATGQECRLALSLALDVSSSVDAREYRLQTHGLAAALVAPEVREAFLAEPTQLVALQVFEWSGWQQQLIRQDWMMIRSEDSARAYDHYESMLSTENQQGLARELARMNLPANIYTQWYWKTDLHNLFHFLHLRADPHAQYEIRAYAEALCDIVKDWVPAAWSAFEDYRLNAVHISGKAMAVLRRRLAGETVTQEESGMSKGEWREFEGVVRSGD